MRIGLFTDTYPPYINGVSTSILMLKNALEKAGHSVYVVTVNNEDLNYKVEEENHILRIPGIPTGIYDYRLTGIYPLRAINRIKKWNLDVIHSHTEFGIGTFARIIAKQYNIPLVHTYHTMYEDYVHYLTKGHFLGPSKKIVQYLTLFYCDKTNTELIVPTKKAYALFKEKYKVDRNVYVIPTGIEVNRFYKASVKDSSLLRTSLGFLPDDTVVLFVGRIASEKNIMFLLDSHKDLVKKDKSIKLLIIGDGPDLETYKKYVIKNKLDNNIIFLGKVAWEKIPIYYKMSNIFATASTSETQGLTVIEAMAAGIAPVCINDDSFLNVVIDGLNGFIFKNKRQYKQIINKLRNNPELLLKTSKQAYLNSKEFSSEYYGKRVLEVYNEAITKNKNKKTLVNTVIDLFKGGAK